MLGLPGYDSPTLNVRVLSLAVLSLLIVISSLAGLGPFASSVHAIIPPGYEAFPHEILEQVNARRAEVGEPPVVLDANLSFAAQKHAEYLVANVDRWGQAGFSVHVESPDLPGYYGRTKEERVAAAGFPHQRVGEDVTLVMGGAVWPASLVITRWIDPPLHRRPVLERSIASIGFGYAKVPAPGGGHYHAYVLNAAYDYFAPSKPSGVQPYPADGQNGVPVGWDGIESPDPFPSLRDATGRYLGGYPITVFPVNGGADFLATALTLTEVEGSESGSPVPVVKSALKHYCWAPSSPLDIGREYRAVFTYTMVNEYTGVETSGSLEWTFFTAGGSATTTTSTTTTTTTLPPTTTTTTAASTTTRRPVTPVFADVDAEHPYRVAIEGMAARGIISGYLGDDGARTFRPDRNVARQQFAKMIVGALSLDVAPPGSCRFVDVHSTWPYPSGFVAAAALHGIVRGTSLDPPRFSSWAPVTRGQVLTMAVRALGSLYPEALDEPPAGFVGHCPSGDLTHGANIRTAEYNGLLAGIGGLGRRWDIWQAADRGETAQILWNLLLLLEVDAESM